MLRAFLFAMLLFSILTSAAQDKISKTETKIRQLEQQVVNAVLEGDTNTLKLLWAPEFLVNNPRGSITRSADSVLLLQKNSFLDYSVFERNIEAFAMQKKFAITMGNETFVSRSDTSGVKAGQTYKRRFTNIWMKKKGRWLQVARHASIICQ